MRSKRHATRAETADRERVGRGRALELVVLAVGVGRMQHLVGREVELELLAAFLYRIPTREPMRDLNGAPHAEVARIDHLRVVRMRAPAVRRCAAQREPCSVRAWHSISNVAGNVAR